MKKLLLLIPVLLILGIIFYACQDNNIVEPQTKTTINKLVGGYDIVLIGGAPVNNGDGTYTWTWSVTNTNPGNGTEGTTQNLSHWDLVPGACLILDNILSAAYSYDGNDWTSFTPKIEQDESISNTCEIETGPVLKFDFGTGTPEGSNTSYYRLVINKNYAVDPNALLYYKSGTVTGCGSGTFDGIGCETDEKCYTYDCQTAFGGNTEGPSGPKIGAWWFYYINNGETQTIWAGKTMNAGTVQYTGGQIVITLNEGWSLQEYEWDGGVCGVPSDIPYSEPVKIKGYNTLPTSRPVAGLFTGEGTYKGTSLTVPFASYSYFVIHLDLVNTTEVPCPEE